MSPMRPRETSRSGGKRRQRARPAGPTSSAARSVCCTAHVFGAASASTKTSTTLTNRPTAHADAAERAARPRAPASAVCTDWHDEHDEQQRVEEPLVVLDEPQQRRPRRGARLLGQRRAPWPRLMRVRPVSATARKSGEHEQHDDHDDHRDGRRDSSRQRGRSRRRRPAGRVSRPWNCASSSRSRACMAASSLVGVVVPSTWRMPCTTSSATSSS